MQKAYSEDRAIKCLSHSNGSTILAGLYVVFVLKTLTDEDTYYKCHHIAHLSLLHFQLRFKYIIIV